MRFIPLVGLAPLVAILAGDGTALQPVDIAAQLAGTVVAFGHEGTRRPRVGNRTQLPKPCTVADGGVAAGVWPSLRVANQSDVVRLRPPAQATLA